MRLSCSLQVCRVYLVHGVRHLLFLPWEEHVCGAWRRLSGSANSEAGKVKG